MKKRQTLLLLVLLIYQYTYSQKLTDCSNCHLKQISQSDIKENELYEIALLRNEIFARHNYSFKNERLSEVFYEFDWFNPNSDIISSEIVLNSIEKSNIIVFKTKENIIKQERKRIIQELKKLKNSINLTENLNSFISLNGLIDVEDSIYSEISGVIKKVLNSVNFQNINWHKGIAQYEIKIDNGYSISVSGIYIKKNRITILSSDPREHSELMEEDAFDYPSEYHSESEQSIGVEIEYVNGKFVLKKIIYAG